MGQEPIADGLQRLVFAYPGRPELLIKVLRRDYIDSRFGPRASFRSRHRRCGHYTLFQRELREYLVAWARSAACLAHLQEIVGLQPTDLGLGLVVRKVCGHDGQPAPTLSDLLRQGSLDGSRMELLERFLDALLESEIVINNLSPSNILLAADPAGAERFVLIDGFGSSTLIPVKEWFRTLNRQSKRRYLRRLRARIGEELRESHRL